MKKKTTKKNIVAKLSEGQLRQGEEQRWSSAATSRPAVWPNINFYWLVKQNSDLN